MARIPIARALISVSDKSGLAELATGLVAQGVELISSGGTHKFLVSKGFQVREVSAYTGFPEMMDGRVKTLHPKIHGGILARRNVDEDLHLAQQHGIELIDLVVVNLYPFEQTVAKPGVADAEVIENIDIGGPSLVRGAAKNHAFVAIVTCPRQYAAVLAELQQGGTTYELRRRLAGEAYAHTARYDSAIANYFERPAADGPFPPQLRVTLSRQEVLRYGENPHQAAAVYSQSGAASDSLVSARKLHGKELSYNNLLDLDSALAIVRGIASPAAAVIKHNNPCGAACADRLSIAARNALDGDPVSAFGSIIAFNRVVDPATAEVLSEPGRFIEAIVAPSFEPAAVEILTTKPKWKANVRLLEVGALQAATASFELRQLGGGMLMQSADSLADPESEWRVVTETQPTSEQWADLRFAWQLVRYVKSNAIVLAKDNALVGVGAGQMSRVDSTQIAISKAAARAAGSALGSDAFFPFPDSIHLAAQAGVSAIIQPGGSKQDEAVIAACNERKLPMILTGRRHFKH